MKSGASKDATDMGYSMEDEKINLETFDYTLSSDWSDFIKFCCTPMSEKEVEDFWNED
jgi:hypothetical protein